MNRDATRVRSVSPVAARLGAIFLAVALGPAIVSAQWTNRYPRVEGYGHQIYLEGYEMPTLTNGPIDPAASPDGTRLAFASRGWIWVMDLEDGGARRLTSGGEMDARPAWSPDGARIAFVRDDTRDTWIVVVDAATGAEVLRENTPAIELDPAFSADGDRLYFASASAGTIALWALELVPVRGSASTGVRDRLKPQAGRASLGIAPRRAGRRPGAGAGTRCFRGAGGLRAAHAARGQHRLHGAPGAESRRVDGRGQLADPDGVGAAAGERGQSGGVDPSGRAVGHGGRHAAHPRVEQARRGVGVLLARGRQPADAALPGGRRGRAGRGGRGAHLGLGGRDGHRAGAHHARAGRSARARPSGRGRRDRPPGCPGRLPPLVRRPERAGVRLLGGNRGVHGAAGSATVAAVQGLATPEVARTVEVVAGRTTEVEVTLTPVWDARAAGWVSGEHHFHLNYGGPYDLAPADLVPMMRGEALDVATPLLANLHNRFEDQDLWGWERAGEGPLIRFGQEVRSHFLGHVGLIDIGDFFWPWVWGPGYQVYGTDDRENAEALGHARSRGGFGYYVHPVNARGAERAQPWSEVPFENLAPSVPVELVADAVLGDLDALEVVCLWSDETTTTQVWHRFLNLGIPVAPSAGTDVMSNFFRTMAVGTTRVYAMTGGQLNWPAYMDALRNGRTFVTNGPFLDFRLEGAGPGGVVAPGTASWTLDLSSAGGVERVDVLVNGEVAWQSDGLEGSGSRRYEGTLDLPEGGWVAARAVGGSTDAVDGQLPVCAHARHPGSGHRSTEPGARMRAARELAEVLRVARNRLVIGYGDTEIPNLLARFDRARAQLEEWARP